MKKVFLENEGNAYFERNKNHNTNNDIIIDNLNIKNISNISILEIGCSDGWRLNKLYDENNTNNYIGFDPSLEAINYGKKNYPNIQLFQGTCDEINLSDNSIDLILVPFVFMYIDRNLLFKSINEIDRILKNNGKIIITDFYSNRPRKNNYKHLPNSFIHKQNYFEIFTASNNYFLEKLFCYNHNTTNSKDIYDDTCFYAELKKDLNNLFN